MALNKLSATFFSGWERKMNHATIPTMATTTTARINRTSRCLGRGSYSLASINPIDQFLLFLVSRVREYKHSFSENSKTRSLVHGVPRKLDTGVTAMAKVTLRCWPEVRF